MENNLFESKSKIKILFGCIKILNLNFLYKVVNIILTKGVFFFKKSNEYYYLLVSANCKTLIRRESANLYQNKYNNKSIFTRKGFQSSDLEVLNQVLGRKEYQICIDLLYKYFNNPNQKVIFDLGANIGLTTAFFKRALNNTKIICVEPEVSNFEMLKLNTNEIENTLLIQGGIWNCNCTLEIETPKGDGREWSTATKISNKKDGLQGYCLNSLIEKHKIDSIDILKIDIEGAEKILFEKENYALQFLSKTKVIAVEIHDHLVDRNQIENILTNNHFKIWNTSDFTVGFNQKLIK